MEAAHSKKSKERQNIDFNLFFHNCLSVSFSTTDGLLDQCAVDGLRSPFLQNAMQLMLALENRCFIQTISVKDFSGNATCIVRKSFKN